MNATHLMKKRHREGRPCDCPTEYAEGDWQLEGRDSESEPGDD